MQRMYEIEMGKGGKGERGKGKEKIASPEDLALATLGKGVVRA